MWHIYPVVHRHQNPAPPPSADLTRLFAMRGISFVNELYGHAKIG